MSRPGGSRQGGVRDEPGSSASGYANADDDTEDDDQRQSAAADDSEVNQQAFEANHAEDHDGQPVVMSMEAGSSAATIKAVNASSRSKHDWIWPRIAMP